MLVHIQYYVFVALDISSALGSNIKLHFLLATDRRKRNLLFKPIEMRIQENNTMKKEKKQTNKETEQKQ